MWTRFLQELVHSELDDVFGDSDVDPTDDDLKKLVLLERCIKESLRYLPASLAAFNNVEKKLLFPRLTHGRFGSS